MGKFLPLPINAFLNEAHFLIELGESTNNERNYPIKPNLHKLFIVGEKIPEDSLPLGQRLAIFPREVIINEPYNSILFFNENVQYFDTYHLHLRYKVKEKNLHIKSESHTYDIIGCIEAGSNVYINNKIGQDLTKIFKYFRVDEDLIDSFILLSIVLAFKPFTEMKFETENNGVKKFGENYNKPTNDEKELSKILNEFLNNPAVKACKETAEKINNIQEYKEVKDKILQFKHQQRKEFSVRSDAEKSSKESKTQFGVTPLVRDHIKEIFIAMIFVFSIRNNVKMPVARKIGYYILAYFNFIEEFSDSKEFYNQYDSSYFKNMAICKNKISKRNN